MSNLQRQLQNETRDMRMTDAEKAAMRARLVAAMTPARSVPHKSPYQWMFYTRTVATFALVLVIIVSTGTAYAAEGALPGATLYPIKTNVIEPLTVALATTPAAKAEANATIAATRVEEAQTLAAQGNLTPDVAKVISENYTVHATAALALAADADGEGSTEPAQDSSSGSGEPGGNPASASATAGEPRQGLATASVKSDDGTDAVTSEVTGGVGGEVAVAPQAKVMSLSLGLATGASNTATATASTTAPKAPTSFARKASTTVLMATATTTATSTNSLSHRIRATLSTQAKILDSLNVEVGISMKHLK